MKKVIISAISIILVLSIFTAKASASAPSVIIDGELQSYDQSPIIENGTTLVPLRGIFETLGADVRWDQSNQTVSATYEGSSVELIIGDETAYVNGEANDLLVPGQIVNNRTLVPLRFVSESLGADVHWDGETRTITITSSNGESSSIPEPESKYEKELEKVKSIFLSSSSFGADDSSWSVMGADYVHTRDNGVYILAVSPNPERDADWASRSLNTLGIYSGNVSDLKNTIERVSVEVGDETVGNVRVHNTGGQVRITW